MSDWPGFRKRALLLGVVSGMFCGSALAQSSGDISNDREVEEVVVTGSYLRGSALDAPSPVQVLDRTSMEAQGASQIWDVIKNLEINSGSITNERADGGNAALGTLSGTANVNLRNLGENSTLTLINGKRQVVAATTTPSGGEFVDINTIPLVMVERMEVLTDGGSALYGSDAVAGVVNIISAQNSKVSSSTRMSRRWKQSLVNRIARPALSGVGRVTTARLILCWPVRCSGAMRYRYRQRVSSTATQNSARR